MITIAAATAIKVRSVMRRTEARLRIAMSLGHRGTSVRGHFGTLAYASATYSRRSPTSTHSERHSGASNGSAKYNVSLATASPSNSMMLIVFTGFPS